MWLINFPEYVLDDVYMFEGPVEFFHLKPFSHLFNNRYFNALDRMRKFVLDGGNFFVCLCFVFDNWDNWLKIDELIVFM